MLYQEKSWGQLSLISHVLSIFEVMMKSSLLSIKNYICKISKEVKYYPFFSWIHDSLFKREESYGWADTMGGPWWDETCGKYLENVTLIIFYQD